MKLFALTLFVTVTVLGTACSKEEAQQAGAEAVPPAPDVAQAPMEKASAAPSMEAAATAGTGQAIDHVRDEAEFMLKRSLAGLESLKEDIKDSAELAKIDKDIADIKAKLDAM